MNNATRFFLTEFAIDWCQSYWFRASRNYSCQKRTHRALKIISIFIMFLILLSSCSAVATRSYTQSSPILTPTPPQPSFSRISKENAVNLSLIQEWQLKYVNAIDWAMDSIAFTVAGGNSDKNNDPDMYTYNISKSEVIWSSKALGGGRLTYHPNNQVIAVPYFEGISFFDAITGQKVRQIDHNSIKEKQCIGLYGIEFTPDGSKIITLDTQGDYGGTTSIYIWDATTDQCLGTLVEEVGITFDFELSRDGHFLVLGLAGALSEIPGVLEPQVRVWNIVTQQLICRFKGARPVAFSLNGSLIAAANVDNNGEVDLWDAKSCQLLETLHREEEENPYSMDFSPDGQLLAIGGENTFQIWAVANRTLLFESNELKDHVDILAFSPDGRFLLSKTDRSSIDDKATITLWGVRQ